MTWAGGGAGRTSGEEGPGADESRPTAGGCSACREAGARGRGGPEPAGTRYAAPWGQTRGEGG